MRNGRRTCHAASGTVYKYLNFKFGKSFLHALPGQRQRRPKGAHVGQADGGRHGVGTLLRQRLPCSSRARDESGTPAVLYMSVLRRLPSLSRRPLLSPATGSQPFFYWCCMDSAVKKFFAKLASEMFDFQWFNKLFIYLRMSQKPLRKTHNQTYLPPSSFPFPFSSFLSRSRLLQLMSVDLQLATARCIKAARRKLAQ